MHLIDLSRLQQTKALFFSCSFISDPIYKDNCLNYYRCVFSGTRNEMTTFFNCPDGLAFDSEINACNFPELVKCIDPNIVKQKQITKSPEQEKTYQTTQTTKHSDVCPKGNRISSYSNSKILRFIVNLAKKI